MTIRNILVSFILLFFCGTLTEASFAATSTKKKSRSSASPTKIKQFNGNASWYGIPFHGRRTASGEIFNMNKLTAAHLRLPFHTKVLVENPRTGKSIVVNVNDRGPYVKTRVLDMSREAARRLGTIHSGVAYVECLVIDDDDDGSGSSAPSKKQ